MKTCKNYWDFIDENWDILKKVLVEKTELSEDYVELLKENKDVELTHLCFDLWCLEDEDLFLTAGDFHWFHGVDFGQYHD